MLTAEQREKHELGYDDFWVELGLGDRTRCSPPGVHVGAPVVFSAPTRAIGELLVGPAMDNRVGLALMDALIDVTERPRLRAVARRDRPGGERPARRAGARARASASTPRSRSTSVSSATSRRSTSASTRTSLGDGPIVVHRDTGIIYDRLLTQHLLALGRAHDLPAQDGLFAGYGSDGLALAESGSPTALLTVGRPATRTPRSRRSTRAISTATVDLLRALVTAPLPQRPR